MTPGVGQTSSAWMRKMDLSLWIIRRDKQKCIPMLRLTTPTPAMLKHGTTASSNQVRETLHSPQFYSWTKCYRKREKLESLREIFFLLQSCSYKYFGGGGNKNEKEQICFIPSHFPLLCRVQMGASAGVQKQTNYAHGIWSQRQCTPSGNHCARHLQVSSSHVRPSNSFGCCQQAVVPLFTTLFCGASVWGSLLQGLR